MSTDAEIKAAIAHPLKPVPLESDFAPEEFDGLSLTPVFADRFGRLWVWWKDTRQVQMIFDPREARG